MAKPDRRSETVSIVLRGSFNPTILHPRWPDLFELLAPWGLETADDVAVEIVHQEITKLKFANTVIEVEPNRFQIRDSDPSRKAADFCLGLFGTKLRHTPVHAVGINYDVEMEVPDRQYRDAIGYKLAPPDSWGPLKEPLQGERGGLLSLHVRSPVDDSIYLERYRDVRVLAAIAHSRRFMVSVNGHFAVGKEDSPVSVGDVIELVLGGFEEELQFARDISTHIWSLGSC